MSRRDLAAAPDRARLEIEFEQPYLLGPLFGDYDRHLITIEQRLGVHIAARGNRVQIEGEPDAAARARDVLIGLYNRLDSGHDVDAEPLLDRDEVAVVIAEQRAEQVRLLELDLEPRAIRNRGKVATRHQAATFASTAPVMLFGPAATRVTSKISPATASVSTWTD